MYHEPQVALTAWTTTWIPLLSSVTSLVLTAALVYLYFQQKTISERQYELMESNVRPVLQVRDLTSTRYDEADIIEFRLENVGVGKALHVRLRWSIAVVNGDETPVEEFPFFAEEEFSIVPRIRELRVDDNGDSDVLGTSGGVLNPGEGEEYSAVLSVRLDRGDEETVDISFSDSMAMLQDTEGVETVRVQIFLDYEDINGSQFSEELLEREFAVVDRPGLEDVV